METVLEGIHIRLEGLRHPFGYPSVFPDIELEGMPGEVARSLVARGVGWQIRMSSGVEGDGFECPFESSRDRLLKRANREYSV